MIKVSRHDIDLKWVWLVGPPYEILVIGLSRHIVLRNSIGSCLIKDL